MNEKFLDGLHEQAWFTRYVHVVLLVLVTALVFSNTLENDYHLDSIFRVKDNTEINEFWPPTRFFTDLRTGSIIPEIAEYRPIMPLSHAINNAIASATGTSKLAGFHVGNIAIHIGSAILVYLLFCQLIGRWGSAGRADIREIHHSHKAFIAALIFAVHPISGAAVNYIAARDLLLMVFFFMAAMLVYVRMRSRGDSVGGWIISLLLLSIAILSKQVAIMGFGLVFLYEWILQGSRLGDWKLWGRTLAFSIPTAGYFLLRWLWIAKQNPQDALRIPVDIYYPLTMAKAHVFYYMKNFLWPFEMRALAKFDLVQSIFDPAALAGVVFIVATLVLAWVVRERKPLISFAILSYWLLFSLTASIFPFRYVVTDYRQYLPFAFLCLLLGVACWSLKPRIVGPMAMAVLILYFSMSSYHLNQHWKTEESFWQQSVKYGATALAHNNFGLAIAGKNPELAEQNYREALRQNPFHIYANINLAMLYVHQRKFQEGVAILRKTAALNPNTALAHYWLSRGLKAAKQQDEALKELRRAADLDPRRLQYQHEAALALQAEGDMRASIPYLERLVRSDKNYKNAGFLLGFAYQKTSENDRAIAEYRRYLDAYPKHVQAQFNLAYALMETADCVAAINHFKTVLSLRPQYREVHRHLSSCYRSMRDEPAAAEHEKLYQGGP